MTALPDIDALWDHADNAGSEARFRAALSAAETSGDAAHLAELLSQLARAVGRQGRFDEAHSILDRGERISSPGMAEARVRLALERGRLYNSSGAPDAALPHFRAAFDAARTAQLDKLAVDAIHMIAIAVPTPEERVEWNLRGVALAEELGQRRWLRALYNNLGEACAAQRNHALALETFRKLLALEEELGLPPDIMARKDVAKMLRLLGRHDEAMEVLAPVAEDLRSRGTSNAWVDEQVAECLLARGRAAEAVPLFARAYAGQKDNPWVLGHEPERLERLRRLAGEA